MQKTKSQTKPAPLKLTKEQKYIESLVNEIWIQEKRIKELKEHIDLLIDSRDRLIKENSQYRSSGSLSAKEVESLKRQHEFELNHEKIMYSMVDLSYKAMLKQRDMYHQLTTEMKEIMKRRLQISGEWQIEKDSIRLDGCKHLYPWADKAIEIPEDHIEWVMYLNTCLEQNSN